LSCSRRAVSSIAQSSQNPVIESGRRRDRVATTRDPCATVAGAPFYDAWQ